MAWFAWRGGQPMELAQFNGLTYFEFLSWHKLAYQQLAEQYQATNPGKVADTPCYGIELGVSVFARLPVSGFYALAGIFPELQRIINQSDIQAGFIQKDVSWSSFFSAWWYSYENLVLSGAESNQHNPVVYCRIQPYNPSPADLSILLEPTRLNP